MWARNTYGKGLPDGAILPAPISGFYADGYLGQYLVVIPKHRLVAVRQMRSPQRGKVAVDKIDSFSEFPDMVRALVQ